MIDFIGIGAQKSGTSWLYACLYEHPEICAPIKELHFFSRARYEAGIEWYESHFSGCEAGKKRGEFSTSYLYDAATPARIKQHYPDVRLIAIIRHPVDRAVSHYRNAIKTGEISPAISFEDFLANDETCRAQGCYTEQIRRYRDHFSAEQLLVIVYEDIARDPAAVVRTVYRHLGVDETFVPSQLHARINIARTPKFAIVERLLHGVAETLRRIGLDAVVWRIKTSGLTDWIRRQNTRAAEASSVDEATLSALRQYYHDDVAALSRLLNRNLTSEWKL